MGFLLFWRLAISLAVGDATVPHIPEKLLTVRLFIPCVTLCCCLCRTALLYLGQVAVVNENLFSTGLPG